MLHIPTYIFLSADQAVTMATVPPTGSDSIKAIVVASIIGSCAVVVFTVLLVCGLLYCLCQGVRVGSVKVV